MEPRIPRREALRRLALYSAAATAPGWLTACSKKLTCTDVTGLSPEDVRMRNEVAAYVDQAPDPSKKCNNCLQFVAGAQNACGTCKVVKGPIHPEGWCKLFVAKPA